MDQPFEWKGVRFSWNRLGMSFKGYIPLSGKTYLLLVRETRAGNWESWVRWNDGYTALCTMATRDLALEGAIVALKDFFETTLRDLEPFEPSVKAR